MQSKRRLLKPDWGGGQLVQTDIYHCTEHHIFFHSFYYIFSFMEGVCWLVHCTHRDIGLNFLTGKPSNVSHSQVPSLRDTNTQQITRMERRHRTAIATYWIIRIIGQINHSGSVDLRQFTPNVYAGMKFLQSLKQLKYGIMNKCPIKTMFSTLMIFCQLSWKQFVWK